MKYFDEKAYKIIGNMVIEKYKPITVNSGLCRFNFKCHKNAVHDAIENKHDKVAMCFYFDKNQPIIHFLNVNEKGEYTDNTLGHWSNINKYFLIQHIHKDDFFNINKIFTDFREDLKNKLPFIIKKLSNAEF